MGEDSAGGLCGSSGGEESASREVPEEVEGELVPCAVSLYDEGSELEGDHGVGIGAGEEGLVFLDFPGAGQIGGEERGGCGLATVCFRGGIDSRDVEEVF